MVAGLHFEFGVPHYRLAKIQERRGLARPPENQDRMIKQVALSAAPVFDELVKLAAEGDLLHSDDTRMKVLKHLKNREDLPLKKTQNTVIISLSKGYKITLPVTGTDQTGANVSKALANRSDSLPPPIHMCDGLAANKVSTDVVVANCLARGRRKFFDIKTSLRVEGAPLSNAEAERSIKRAICHQKNSLFYKTMNGAKQGDII